MNSVHETKYLHFVGLLSWTSMVDQHRANLTELCLEKEHNYCINNIYITESMWDLNYVVGGFLILHIVGSKVPVGSLTGSETGGTSLIYELMRVLKDLDPTSLANLASLAGKNFQLKLVANFLRWCVPTGGKSLGNKSGWDPTMASLMVPIIK